MITLSYIENKTILITGGTGFVGSHLITLIKSRTPKKLILPKHSDINLKNRLKVDRLLKKTKPNIVIHLAGRVGGIEETRKHPGKFFYDNAIMALNIIDSSYIHGVEKFIGMGTVCSYPKFSSIPFKEEDLWNGYPEETNAPYGLAKKMMLVQTQAYKREYNFNGIHLLTVNLYGPRDNFDPNSSHVIPGMINKYYEAKQNHDKEITFWGDGTPTREFLYVTDCARAILLATEKYNKPEPINVGSGMEISIKNLSKKIQEIMGYEGRIIWDKSKPNGQPRRCLDTSKAEKEFGFKAKINFDVGLKNTIKWYIKNH